ncbi:MULTISPECIES: TolC family outer membrane protein [Pseudovibrio]|uniref:TolC family outer membrane protein n=1 Tax=Stappiaceae TaxID=2821832 RepID=UPI0023672DED|nr:MULTISPECIES: TolC family outer membrane protein [Pseudovibrio]MDD7908468.1 TolC family outer membrane protein [Pseudovibrio exalbescens]MDX5592668.1 TolC family outer membrane protein [Pseudovibrio sp. SPO723]
MVSASAVHAQSIRDALSATYQNNPTLNAARAQLRGVDENVPQALAGWRPSITGSAAVGMVNQSDQGFTGGGFSDTTVAVQVVQPLFRGFRTVNSTRQAEAIVRAQREDLRVTEQTALLQAATAYMDVIRDTGIVALRRSDLKFQEELVRASKDRFSVGEGTRTDVAQAEAGRARSQSALNTALANLNTSRAVFRQVIGVDPKNLNPRSNVASLLPKSVSQAIAVGQEEHPSIMSALHFVDAGIFAVKTAEGTLLPTVNVEGNLSSNYRSSNGRSLGGNGTTNTASIFGRVTVPIYQQGTEYSAIRQAKEELGQTEILVDVARDTVRAQAISSWGQLNASEASITAAQAEVAAATLALEGVVEEQRVGQRTTLDVLDSQSDLVDARVTLITAQRDKVVAAYALLSSVGRLNYTHLGLTVPQYDPREHYNAVRDKWIGLRTPDGR